MIPTAKKSAVPSAGLFLLGKDGIKPFIILPTSGAAIKICIKKATKIIPTSAMINASILRMPSFCKYSNKNVSSTVRLTPHTNGKPVSNCMPIAIPKTSARSQAAMATSASKYNMKFIPRG